MLPKEVRDQFRYALPEDKGSKVYAKNRLELPSEKKPPELNMRTSGAVLEAMGFKKGVQYTVEPHEYPVFNSATYPGVKEFQFREVDSKKVVPKARLIETAQYRIFINPDMEIQVIEGIPHQATIKGALEELPGLQVAASGIPSAVKDGKPVYGDIKVFVNVYGIVGGHGEESIKIQDAGRKMDKDHGRLVAEAFNNLRGFIFSQELVMYGSDSTVDLFIRMMTLLFSMGGFYVGYVTNEKAERTLEKLDERAKKNKK